MESKNRHNIMNSKIIIAFSLVAAMFFNGCTKENYSEIECLPDGIGLVSVELVPESDDASIILESNVYIFDSNNLFVTRLLENQILGNTVLKYRLELPEGQYTAHTWINHNDNLEFFPETPVKGETKLSEMYLMHSDIVTQIVPTRNNSKSNNSKSIDSKSIDDKIINGPDNVIHHGTADLSLVKAKEYNTLPIVIRQQSKDINLNVSFREPDGTSCVSDTEHGYYAYIQSQDALFNFDNSVDLARSEIFYYKPQSQTDIENADDYSAKFHLMSLRYTTPTKIILTRKPIRSGETPDIFFEGDLHKYLKGTGHPTQESLDKKHKYNIDLVFDCTHDGSTNVTASIWIDGWKYMPVDGGDI